MNLKAGYPFWLIKNGLPFTYPKLDTDIDTEVAIIGAGISGALVRYHLLEAGVKCVMLDARTIGLGSTSASTSLLQYEIDTPLIKLIEMVGKEKAERAYQLCGEAILELAEIARKIKFKRFEMKKSLYYAAYKKDTPKLKRECKAREEAGFKVKYLDENQVKAVFGIDSHGAILSELAAQTDAYAFTHCLLQYQKGNNIYDRSPVTRIKHSKTGVSLETENGFKVKAQKLVYATGYEVVEFIEKDIVKLLSTYAVVSEQYATNRFWKDNVLIWNTAIPYLYLRTTGDGRILIGGRDEDFYNPAKRDALIGKKSKQLVGDFNKLFPNLEFKPEFSWTGTFGSTKDGLPYIGEYKKLPNSYFALGFGGNGITFSQTAAVIIRDMIIGKPNKDAEIFAFDR